MTRKAIAIGLASLGVAVAATAWALRAPGALTINGKTVPTNFIVEGGRTYAPLSDVAKALNAKVVKTEEGYTIAAGGGEMVHGLEGKVGETLSGTGIQFTVVKVVRGEHYQRQFGTGTIDPSLPDSEVVALVCKLRNTAKTAQFTNPLGGERTGLADWDEHTIPPQRGVSTDLVPGDANILPGAVYDFALVFMVPKKAKLKALVYETTFLTKDSVFRVNLPPPAGD